MSTATPAYPTRAYARSSVADLLVRLGEIPAARVRMDPPPGTATLTDLIAVNERKDGSICELVDGALVEKAMGQLKSWVAATIIGELYAYLATNRIGILYAPNVVLQILPNLGRGPDVSFIALRKLPGGRLPTEAVPSLAPDLAVEVLSLSNTRAEMNRKREEYFRAGVALIWEVDPRARIVTVYTALDNAEVITDVGVLSGRDILPGLVLPVARLFAQPGDAVST